MQPEIPTGLLADASQWHNLHRSQRNQLWMALRRMCLTYSQVQSVIPVPNGTFSNWSREAPLTRAKIDAIKRRSRRKQATE